MQTSIFPGKTPGRHPEGRLKSGGGLEALGKVAFRERLHEPENLCKFAGRCKENDAKESIGGYGTEARSVHTQDARRTQQSNHVVFVRLARRKRDLRHRVKRGR